MATAIPGDQETEGREKTTEPGDDLTAQQARIRRLNRRARRKAHQKNGPFEEVKREDIYMQTRRYDKSILRAKM
jgi:hypothetical protein